MFLLKPYGVAWKPASAFQFVREGTYACECECVLASSQELQYTWKPCGTSVLFVIHSISKQISSLFHSNRMKSRSLWNVCVCGIGYSILILQYAHAGYSTPSVCTPYREREGGLGVRVRQGHWRVNQGDRRSRHRASCVVCRVADVSRVATARSREMEKEWMVKGKGGDDALERSNRIEYAD